MGGGGRARTWGTSYTLGGKSGTEALTKDQTIKLMRKRIGGTRELGEQQKTEGEEESEQDWISDSRGDQFRWKKTRAKNL